MIYLNEEDFSAVFALIQKNLTRQEEIPDYREYKEGMAKLFGVIERARMDTYYPTFLGKAVYILVQINQGHFFPNGNKRLALVTFLWFCIFNYDGDPFIEYSKEEYRKKLESLFPEFEDYKDFDFSTLEFAYYNLSIIIADINRYGISFDDLKARVAKFLQFSIK